MIKKETDFSGAMGKQFTIAYCRHMDAMFCKICREYPSVSYKFSTLFVGKKVDWKDTLLTHQLSAKHIACTSKHEKESAIKVGSLDKALAKVKL